MTTLSKCLFAAACAAVMVTGLGLVPPTATLAGGAEADTVARKAERKYKCTKCRQVFTFDRPGNYKCPTCGKPLIPAS
jgi:hypothetical protein